MFKVGDRVRWVNHPHVPTGRIKSLPTREVAVIELDNPLLGGNSWYVKVWYVKVENLRLVNSTNKLANPIFARVTSCDSE